MQVTTNAASLAQTFRAYADVYGSRHPEASVSRMLIENGRKLATDLYNVSAEIAPTPAKIAADVQKQGWKIPKRFPDGRLGRGSPKQWLAGSAPKRGRGRPRKSAQPATVSTERPTLEQMQAFVIKRRTAATKYIASGWLGAVQDLGGSLKQSSGQVNKTRGRAEVQDDAILIINDTPGINVINSKYKLVQRAIQRRISDLRVYLVEHLSPAAIKKAA